MVFIVHPSNRNIQSKHIKNLKLQFLTHFLLYISFENLIKSIIIHLAISEALSQRGGRNSYDLSGLALPPKAASMTLKCQLARAAQLYCVKGSYTAHSSPTIL